MVSMLVHLTVASPLVRDLSTLLCGLSGLCGPAEDAPPYASLGLMILSLLAGLLVVNVAAGLAGSALRALVPRRPSVAPGRRGWLAASLVAPVLLCTVGLSYLSWTEWRVPTSVSLPDAIDHTRVRGVLARARPNTLPATRSCAAIIETLGGGTDVSATVARGDIAVYMATVAAFAISSDDRTLQAMGWATADALSLSEVKRAAEGVNASAHYCASVLSGEHPAALRPVT
jgi:hypothetical protein